MPEILGDVRALAYVEAGQKRRGSGQKVHFGGQKAKFAGQFFFINSSQPEFFSPSSSDVCLSSIGADTRMRAFIRVHNYIRTDAFAQRKREAYMGCKDRLIRSLACCHRSLLFPNHLSNTHRTHTLTISSGEPHPTPAIRQHGSVPPGHLWCSLNSRRLQNHVCGGLRQSDVAADDEKPTLSKSLWKMIRISPDDPINSD